jgi:hypothetical protein
MFRSRQQLHTQQESSISHSSACDRDAWNPLPDCVLIVIAALSPVLLGLGSLGFYSDDWSFLASMHLGDDRSISGVFRELWTHDNAVRPVQWGVLALLYKLFGVDPLGYHVVNSMFVAAGALLFYLCMRELREPPLFAIAVPLLFALLPHYSADRLWIAAMQANVSACLFFLSFYADSRALASPRAFWRWKVLGLAALLLSGLAYEVFLPLFVVGAVLLWVRFGTPRNGEPMGRAGRRKCVLNLTTNMVALGCVVVSKAIFSERNQLETSPGDYLASTARKLMTAFEVGYIDHVVKIPLTANQIIKHYASGVDLIVATALGITVAVYLLRSAAKTGSLATVPASRMLAYVALGIVTFAAGFSLFPIDQAMTGINNRTANAASVGVALSLVGAVGLIITRLTPDRILQGRLFAGGIAVVGMSGFLTVNTVTGFWTESYARQLDVLAALDESVPRVPPGTAIMLDGVCPFHGPAIVFDTSWDLAGALMLRHGHTDLRADVLHKRFGSAEHGMIVGSYGSDAVYEYGSRLLVYNYGLRNAFVLSDETSAQAYLAETRHGALPECTAGRHGFGARILGVSLRSVRVRLSRGA